MQRLLSPLVVVLTLGCSADPQPADAGAQAPSATDGGQPPPTDDAGTSSPPPPPDAGSADAGPPTPPPDTQAADLAAELGLPAQLLVGVKHNMDGVDALTAPMDIRYVYLVGDGGAGNYGWPTWNDPPGRYVDYQAQQMADAGSVPMFTLYSMAAWGDGNLDVLTIESYMRGYWADAQLLFERLALYGGPAIVQLEPDFWGYANIRSQGVPQDLPVLLGDAPDACADLPHDVSGLARCLITLARTLAPQVRVGLHASVWGDSLSPAAHARFLVDVGAQEADFFTVEMLDRDAGCYEAQAEGCTRNDGPWYWDEANLSAPHFAEHLERVALWQGIIGLPVLWWQLPMGVPSDEPGGTPGHYRDNRVRYIFDHPEEFAAIGGLAVIFGEGAVNQTTPATDDGQFNAAASAYAATPVLLPTR